MKINIKTIFFYIMILLSVIQFSLTKLEIVYSNIVIIVFIPILLMFLIKEKYKNFDIVLVFILYIILITIVKEVGIGIGASIIVNILFILYMSNYKIKGKEYRNLYIILFILGIWSIILSFNYKYEVFYNKYIWFNPNGIGLMILIAIVNINAIGIKLNKSKCILWIYNILAIIGVLNTESRTTLIAVIFFLILSYCIPKKILNKKVCIRLLYIIIIIIGISIPYLYSYMYSQNIEFNIPFSNKTLYTGREILWGEVIEKMEYEPIDYLFGIGGNSVLSFSATVHSAFFRLLARYGILGFLGFYVFVIDKIEKIIKNDKDNSELVFVIAWLAILISGFFEVSYLITTYAILMSLPLGIGVSEIKQIEEKKNEESITCSK